MLELHSHTLTLTSPPADFWQVVGGGAGGGADIDSGEIDCLLRSNPAPSAVISLSHSPPSWPPQDAVGTLPCPTYQHLPFRQATYFPFVLLLSAVFTVKIKICICILFS